MPATCSIQYAGHSVLREPPSTGLPAGLLASLSLVAVTHSILYIQVVNVGSEDVVLYPCTVIGTLSTISVVSLPAEVRTATATMFSQEAFIVQDKIRSLDRSPLAEQDQRNVQLLLNEYSSVILLQRLRLGLYYLDFYDSINR